MSLLNDKISRFRQIVWRYYRAHGRHDLPWRKTIDLYRILVSEVMLQQTQVDRVIPFYKKFIKQFPTAKKLAIAPLSDVLVAWQGLGYNRRAKMLHAAAKKLSEIPRSNLKNLASRFDLDVSELEKLPGVGPYTARAVAAFACNQDVVVIETNIRTAIIHHFFPKKKKVSDAEIEKVLRQALPKGRSREWYSALMDYGAHLKRSGISHNAKSKGYTKQSKFAGSLRQARGAILRELARGPSLRSNLLNVLGADRHEQIMKALNALEAEKLLLRKNGRYMLEN
jgi:A/G-specific adenine glycosylase